MQDLEATPQKQWYVEKITAEYQKSIEGIFSIADYLVDAKEKLPRRVKEV